MTTYKSIGLPDYTPRTIKEWFAAKENEEIAKYGDWKRVPDHVKMAFLRAAAVKAGLTSISALKPHHLKKIGLYGLVKYYSGDGTFRDGLAKLMAESKILPIDSAQDPSVNVEEEVERYRQGNITLTNIETRREVVRIALEEAGLLDQRGKITKIPEKIYNFFVGNRFNGLNRRTLEPIYNWYKNHPARRDRPKGIKVGEFILYNLGFFDEEAYQRLLIERKRSLLDGITYNDRGEADRIFKMPRINNSAPSSPKHPDDPVGVYKWRAQRYRRLTLKEEEGLIRLSRKGNVAAVEIFIEHYAEPILRCAQKYLAMYKGYSEVGIADLLQAGEMGVRRGIHSFRLEKGMPLRTWLTGSVRRRTFRGTMASNISDEARRLSGIRRKVPKRRVDMPETAAPTARPIDILTETEALDEVITGFISAVETTSTAKDKQLNERNKDIIYSLFGVDKTKEELIAYQNEKVLADRFRLHHSRISQIKRHFITRLIGTDDGRKLAFYFLNGRDRKIYGLLGGNSLDKGDSPETPARKRRLRFRAGYYELGELATDIEPPRNGSAAGEIEGRGQVSTFDKQKELLSSILRPMAKGEAEKTDKRSLSPFTEVRLEGLPEMQSRKVDVSGDIVWNYKKYYIGTRFKREIITLRNIGFDVFAYHGDEEIARYDRETGNFIPKNQLRKVDNHGCIGWDARHRYLGTRFTGREVILRPKIPYDWSSNIFVYYENEEIFKYDKKTGVFIPANRLRKVNEAGKINFGNERHHLGTRFRGSNVILRPVEPYNWHAGIGVFIGDKKIAVINRKTRIVVLEEMMSETGQDKAELAVISEGGPKDAIGIILREFSKKANPYPDNPDVLLAADTEEFYEALGGEAGLGMALPEFKALLKDDAFSDFDLAPYGQCLVLFRGDNEEEFVVLQWEAREDIPVKGVGEQDIKAADFFFIDDELLQDDDYRAAKMIDESGIGANDHVLQIGSGVIVHHAVACAIKGASIDIVQLGFRESTFQGVVALARSIDDYRKLLKHRCVHDLVGDKINVLSSGYDGLIGTVALPQKHYSYVLI